MSYVQIVPTNPISASNSSSSLDFVILGDHFVDFLHQEILLVKAYLQDMIAHLVVSVCRVAVAPPATATTSPFSSDNKGLRLWFFLPSFSSFPLDPVHILIHSFLSIRSWRGSSATMTGVDFQLSRRPYTAAGMCVLIIVWVCAY
jgi:hypothetical protein